MYKTLNCIRILSDRKYVFCRVVKSFSLGLMKIQIFSPVCHQKKRVESFREFLQGKCGKRHIEVKKFKDVLPRCMMKNSL